MHDGEFQSVRLTVEGAAAWITIDRPEKLNALDRRTVEEIADAVDRCVEDPGVRVLVLTGAGEKAFAAGADIAEMSRFDAAEGQAFSRFLNERFSRIERSPKPVIAAVNGFALGGGCELALACHVRIASENARFSQPEVNLGLIPGAGGTQRLARTVGRGRALAMILTAERIDAREAERIGLVHRTVPIDALRTETETLAATLAAKSSMAVARALEAVLAGGEMALDDALRFEASLFGLCFATEDMREGTRAFLEKRPARFPGR